MYDDDYLEDLYTDWLISSYDLNVISYIGNITDVQFVNWVRRTQNKYHLRNLRKLAVDGNQPEPRPWAEVYEDRT